MLLACDIGNTNFKFAVYDNDQPVNMIIIPKKKFKPEVLKGFKFNHAAISSVIPDVTDELMKLFSETYNCVPFVITHSSGFNIEIDYKTPLTLGIDRICSMEGAFALLKKEKYFSDFNTNSYFVTVDSGTATTINIVKYYGKFIGGIIMPGLQTMINSLKQNTAQLPQITLQEYGSFFGNDTRSSIASGVLNSTISLIEKTNEILLSKGAKEIVFYLTGGNAAILYKNLTLKTFLVDDLVLRGVKAVYDLSLSDQNERNVSD